MVFRAGPHAANFPAMYIVRKSNNTTWLTRKNSDGTERPIPSTSEIAPFASPTTFATDLVTAR